MLLNRRIPLRYMLGKIWLESIYVILIGLVVWYLTAKYRDLIPEMPIGIPTFIGTAISVLLSFKLGQSYDRWWEARKVWGSIVNDSRSYVLQLQSFLPASNEADVKIIAHRHIAWCVCLGQSLRGHDPVENMGKYLSSEDLEVIKKHMNKPLAILQLNAAHLTHLSRGEELNVFEHVQLNNTMVNFSNSMGMAERIKTTVFPVTYRLFLHFLIYVFVVALSIALRDIESYFEIPLLIVISSMFFLLEKSATHLQDPFDNHRTDIPVTTIATNIEINIRQLLGEQDVPEPVTTTKYYSL